MPLTVENLSQKLHMLKCSKKYKLNKGVTSSDNINQHFEKLKAITSYLSSMRAVLRKYNDPKVVAVWTMVSKVWTKMSMANNYSKLQLGKLG